MATGSGLEGIVAADTTISDIDGDKGLLIYRGYLAADVSLERSYESIMALLIEDADPYKARASQAMLEEGAEIGRKAAACIRPHDDLGPMDLVRTCLSAIGWPNSRTPVAEDAYRLVGAMTVFTAWAGRRLKDKSASVPSENIGDSVASAFLQMVHGSSSEDKARALDAYLCLTAEHGLNASTFAGRVAASTNVDMASAVVAAIATLKGPLHGGAPTGVASMWDSIDDPKEAEAYLRAEIDAGNRIMGFGHRVYRTMDPRAAALRKVAERLSSGSPQFAKAVAVEEAALRVLAEKHPERKLATNVEYYTAAVHRIVGIDPALSPAVFALSRTAGWCAHILEQRQTGRLIRPLARYTGRPVKA